MSQPKYIIMYQEGSLDELLNDWYLETRSGDQSREAIQIRINELMSLLDQEGLLHPTLNISLYLEE